MIRMRPILIVVIMLLLLVLGGAGTWYYLYGGNTVAAADLVPEDTVFFATIPNAMEIATDYQTSKLKTLVESPNTKPLSDWVQQQIGNKNLDLIDTFLPNLSGQSFIAITHFDVNHLEKTGFVAAMKSKPGLGNFDAFIDKLKAAYPELLKEGKTGAGNVAGVAYQSLQGPSASDKICVAQVGGWIVTAWGEASLQDWLERYQKKSSTPSLAQNADYQKSLARVGGHSLALVYLNYHAIIDILQKAPGIRPSNPAAIDYLVKKLGAVSGVTLGMNFENGEIVDHYSMLLPRQAQSDFGVVAAPCAYETLNLTGPDTLLYAGYSVDFKKAWQNLQDQGTTGPSGQPANPMASMLTQAAQNWAQGAGIDFQHNILDALGTEASWQLDWSDDTTYPEAGFFVKLAKPDDFKPVIQAIIATVRKTYENQAIIDELTADDRHFATLKFVTQSLPVTPTITEDGPYFAIFLTEQQAVRSFSRQESLELTHNPDFTRQIGDKRNGSAEIVFIDSPKLLDKTYRTVLPFLSMAAMFNPTLASAIKGHDLPQDLTWLAPIGTWSMVISSDDDGLKGYSVSGIGNQGLCYAMTAAGTIATAQAMGYGQNLNGLVPGQGQPLNRGTINGAPSTGVTGPVNPPVDATTNAPPATPTPDSSTNTAPMPNPTAPATNSGTTAPAPDSTTNATPTPAPDTTNSNANPTTPEPSKPQ